MIKKKKKICFHLSPSNVVRTAAKTRPQNDRTGDEIDFTRKTKRKTRETHLVEIPVECMEFS